MNIKSAKISFRDKEFKVFLEHYREDDGSEKYLTSVTTEKKMKSDRLVAVTASTDNLILATADYRDQISRHSKAGCTVVESQQGAEL